MQSKEQNTCHGGRCIKHHHRRTRACFPRYLGNAGITRWTLARRCQAIDTQATASGAVKDSEMPHLSSERRYWRHYWVISSMLVFNARSPDHSRVNGSSWPQQAHMHFPPVALMAKVPPKRQHHHDVPAYTHTHTYALLTHCIALSHRTRPPSQPARASQATVVESRNVNPPRLDALEDRASPSYPNLTDTTLPTYLPDSILGQPHRTW